IAENRCRPRESGDPNGIDATSLPAAPYCAGAVWVPAFAGTTYLIGAYSAAASAGLGLAARRRKARRPVSAHTSTPVTSAVWVPVWKRVTAVAITAPSVNWVKPKSAEAAPALV